MLRFLFVFVSLSFGAACEAQQTDSLIRKSVYFGGGSYYIDDQQVLEISEFIEAIDKLENYEVILFSHTDNIGGEEFNKWLSEKRSEAVFHQLLNNEVPPEYIEIRDFGMNNPLYTNTSHSGRIMNRRVDIILWPVVF